MNPLIEQIYETECVEDGEGNTKNPFPTALRYEQGMALYNLIRREKSESSVEIGMAYGLATLFMCQAHRDSGTGRHVAIDPFERTLYKSIGLLNVKKAGLSDVLEFHEAYSHIALPQLLEIGERFDFAFIDGDHLFDYTLVDFFYIDKLLRPGGHIMFDDTWMPSVRRVLTFVLRNKNYRLAPEFLWETAPLWKRCLNFIKDTAQSPFHRTQFRRFVGHLKRNPLDIGSIYSAGLLIMKGKLDYWVIQKIEDDERPWHHYRAF
jgi:predicted O-methyltransferase YrrM